MTKSIRLHQLIPVALSIFLLGACTERKDNIHHLQSSFHAIIVKNMDASMSWYNKALSFELLDSTHVPSRGLIQANLENETGRLELIELASVNNSIDSCNSNSNLEPGFFKVGFMVHNIDSLMNHFDQAGIDIKGNIVTDPISLNRMIVIKDPDGNRLQFFEINSVQQ
ncbi:MAG: VOC family protein [Saprospiraceae bacterium]|nr:VOC family protein [Saprospiraceae bacterium]